MVKVFRFIITFRPTSTGKVRQIVSIPYSDEVVCRNEMNLQCRYIRQAKMHVHGYGIESVYMEYEKVVEESGYGF